MIHFSCDLCGQILKDERFVVKIEVFAAHEPHELTEEDLDVDQLTAISELLEGLEEGAEPPENLLAAPRYFHYDLCSNCHRRFQLDPLGREVISRLNFSQN